MRQYAGRSPAYVRIRVELMASRGKRGNEARTYLSRSFISPHGFEETMLKLLETYGGGDLTKTDTKKLRVQIREALRRSKADIPPETDLKQIMAKRKQLAAAAEKRFRQKDLVIVFKRIPQRDFERYSASIKGYLIRYLVHKNETARSALRHQGLQWKTYVPGKPTSLFLSKQRGKKRAQRKR